MIAAICDGIPHIAEWNGIVGFGQCHRTYDHSYRGGLIHVCLSYWNCITVQPEVRRHHARQARTLFRPGPSPLGDGAGVGGSSVEIVLFLLFLATFAVVCEQTCLLRAILKHLEAQGPIQMQQSRWLQIMTAHAWMQRRYLQKLCIRAGINVFEKEVEDDGDEATERADAGADVGADSGKRLSGDERADALAYKAPGSSSRWFVGDQSGGPAFLDLLGITGQSEAGSGTDTSPDGSAANVSQEGSGAVPGGPVADHPGAPEVAG